MKIAIIGFARDGQAAFDFFTAQDGHDITICDQDESKVIPEGANAKLGPDYLKDLGHFDLIVRTAGLHPSLIHEANPESPDILNKVTGNIDLFYEYSPSQNIIGVTGTKGKGTTSTLLAEMLKKAGKTVHLGGNIGIPALELLKLGIKADDWIVLEQSSFQLIDQKHSPKIGVCLMVVPEHLDWHVDLDEYIDAKSQLFIHQSATDIAIYFANNEISEDIANASEGKLIPYFDDPGARVVDEKIVIDDIEICEVSEIKLLGKHNWQNVCAAVTAVWQITQDKAAIKSVLTTFKGLEHRLEFVREIKGVGYYDDSFGTTPETAIVAIESFDQPKVVILGGSDKGATFDALANTVKTNNVRHVLTIGERGPTIAQALANIGFTSVSDGGSTMKEIIDHAQNVAQSGDVILLSTACASFGLFKDYKDRGNQFKQVVQSLA